MILNYDILSQIEIQHDYFKGHALSSAEWIPSEFTKATARNLGLAYKSSQGKLKILASTQDDGDKIVLSDKLRDPFFLTFYLKFNEPYWSNLTTISTHKNKCFLFTNLNKKGNDEVESLHTGDFVTESDLIEIVRGTHYPLSKFKIDGIQIKSPYSNGNLSSSFITQINELPYLKTKPLDEGFYEIADPSGKKHEVFIVKDKVNFDGICHLAFSQEFGGIINKDGGWNKCNFLLKFSALSTYWRYYLPMTKIDHFEGVKILNETEKEQFNNGEEVEMINGDKMICFTSTSPIQLQENTGPIFQLKKNVGVENKSEGVIINRLPKPEKATLFRQDRKGNRYSDIYINL